MDKLVDFSSSGSGIPEDNLTLFLTCAAATLQVANTSRFSSPLSTVLIVFQVLYGLFLIVVGSILNILIMFLVMKYRKLKTVIFSIAFQISLGNVFSVTSFTIPIVVTNLAGRWVFGHIVCIMTGFLISMFTVLHTLLILVYFIDLFFFVFTPFQYRTYSFRSTVAMCIICWCSSVTLALIFLPGMLDCYTYSEPLMYCIVSARCSNCTVPLRVIPTIIFCTTTTVAVGLIISLYVKGRKLRKSSHLAQEKKWKDIVTQELKTLNTVTCLFAAVFMVIVPPVVVVYIANSFFGRTASTLALIMAVNIFASLTVLDPLIILKNQDVKEILKQMRRNICK